MNYGQLVRAVEMALDLGEVTDETPVSILCDGVYREVSSICPENINEQIEIIIEAGDVKDPS